MTSLLEAISPTAKQLLDQLLLMPAAGISKSEHHKVHAVRADGQPLCGGGVQGQSRQRVAAGHRPNQLRRVPENQRGEGE